MKNSLRFFLPFIALLAALALCSGCVAILAAGGAAGTVAYLQGALDGKLKGNLEESTIAANKAIQSLGYYKVSETRAVDSAEFVARKEDDTKISIDLERISEISTEVSIRVGTFGDEVLSQEILDEIKKNL